MEKYTISGILGKSYIVFNYFKVPKYNVKHNPKYNFDLKDMTIVKYLESIQSPEDLKKIPLDKLPSLAKEIRSFMIDHVCQTGGHVASNLGAVELTLALHYCYDAPNDKLVWDVGHQSYTHKIITGRRDTFHTLRQYGGISGFPRISESPYDTLSVGHASTSISAALGMAIARDVLKEQYSVVAVIGDGSLSGGLAFEGLNNLGSSSTSMTVVLNDNEMSISRNVGALSRYLIRVMTDKRYNKIKSEIWELLGNLSNVGKGIRSVVSSLDDALKHFVIPGKLFEDMGLRYIGPVNGHNINEMIDVFKYVRTASTGPVLVHVVTKKGKGYQFAENDATKFHGIGCFSPETGDAVKKNSDAPTYSEVFGKTIVELGENRPEIVAITAAMPDGTKLSSFRDTYPDRFFDVGIAEEHAVTFAAGLALRGLRPVIALYSTFLQRAYDQIMHDIAMDKLNVVFCIDRAGLVGDDGPTHHGMFDISFLRTVPGAVVMAPRDEDQLRHMLFTAFEHQDGPVFIRYPRGQGLGVSLDKPMQSIAIGEPEIIKNGKECAIVSIGDFYSKATALYDTLKEKGFTPTLVDARFAKPLNETFYEKLFDTHSSIITLENNTISGGFGSGLTDLAHSGNQEVLPRILRIGLPDEFILHGDTKKLFTHYGLDDDSIIEKVEPFLTKERKTETINTIT